MMWERPAAPFGSPIAPLTPDDALHLLWVYQSIIAMRPMDRGNREFLGMLIRSSATMADYLERFTGESSAGALAPLWALVRKQSAEGGAASARAALELIRAHRGEDTLGGASLYLRRRLTPLARDYQSITVLFGPGLGLGDAITFYQLVAGLRRRGASLTVLDLYPGLWPHLLPGVKDIHYRERPLRPFAELVQGSGEGSGGRSLFVVVDFDGYYFHERGIPRHPDRDVVEISLGRRRIWMRRGNGAFIDVEHFDDQPIFNNYWVVQAMAQRLLGEDLPVWEPLSPPRPSRAPRRGRTVLLNPMSSKPVPIRPEGWRDALRRLRDLLGGGPLDVLVYPGLEEQSRADAGALAALLSTAPGIDARLLTTGSGAPLTPFNTIEALTAAAPDVDLCVTIDTFTAHLVPLLGVPTVVVALKDNREFWVPSRHTLYCIVDAFAEQLPVLSARAIAGHGARDADPRRVEAAAALAAVTDELLRTPPSAEGFQRIHTSLARYLATLPPSSLLAEGRRWLRFWSRLGTAARREPVDPEHLLPFVRRWEHSQFFKLAVL